MTQMPGESSSSNAIIPNSQFGAQKQGIGQTGTVICYYIPIYDDFLFGFGFVTNLGVKVHSS